MLAGERGEKVGRVGLVNVNAVDKDKDWRPAGIAGMGNNKMRNIRTKGENVTQLWVKTKPPDRRTTGSAG